MKKWIDIALVNLVRCIIAWGLLVAMVAFMAGYMFLLPVYAWSYFGFLLRDYFGLGLYSFGISFIAIIGFIVYLFSIPTLEKLLKSEIPVSLMEVSCIILDSFKDISDSIKYDLPPERPKLKVFRDHSNMSV